MDKPIESEVAVERVDADAPAADPSEITADEMSHVAGGQSGMAHGN